MTQILDANVAYWLGNDNFQTLVQQASDPVFRSSPEYVMRLSSIRRGVANFVRIVTGEDLPVRFSTGKQSYATSEKVIVISATSDPRKLDAMVGVALHEAAHIILSNKNHRPESTPLFEWIEWWSKQSMLSMMPISMRKLVKRYTVTEDVIRTDVKLMVNWLEDRRIDNWMYERAIGYRGYYDANYALKWNSERVAKKLKQATEPTVTNYWLHVINMTNPEFDSSVLPGLDELEKLADLPAITRFNHDPRWANFKAPANFPLIISTAIDMVRVLYENAEEDPQQAPQPTQTLPPVVGTTPEEDEDSEGNETGAAQPMIDPENLDMSEAASSSSKPSSNSSKFNKSEVSPGQKEDQQAKKDTEDLVDQLKKIISGAEEMEVLDEDIADQMDVLEASGAMLKKVEGIFKGSARVIVFKKFTEALAQSGVSAFTSRYGNRAIEDKKMVEAIQAGERMGNIMAHQLRILGDERPLTYTRQSSGRLNKRLISELGFESEAVFSQTVIEHMDPVFVHLSVDASGSMSGKKFYSAIKLAVALAKSATKVSKLDVVISLRSSAQEAQVLIAYDSRVDQFVKIRKLFPFLRAVGGTPEGLCFRALRDIINTGSQATRKFFVNLSDGMPEFVWYDESSSYHYHGDKAVRHTATQIQEMRSNGINVISYFIGGSRLRGEHKDFERMYGRDAAFINTESVPDITRTLNACFLKSSNEP